jgi:hypothetical protein
METWYDGKKVEQLFAPVLAILERSPAGISEYALLNELGYVRGDDLELFRAHFFLFHLLYRLRDKLLLEKRYVLSIFCLEIKLSPYQSGLNGVFGTDLQGVPEEADKLREYYLDMDNLSEMDSTGVRQMIDGFYTQLRNWYRRDEDYALLGLDPDTCGENLQKQYRLLVFEHHPDRGGDPGRFRQIQGAMERIKGTWST